MNRIEPHGDAAVATVTQGYRFALDPTPRQRRALASHCGAARYAHNWGLQLVEDRLRQRRTGEVVEVPWTLPALRREWNRTKDQVAPWWAENSKEATPLAWTGSPAPSRTGLTRSMVVARAD
jgi:hypothetical protein